MIIWIFGECQNLFLPHPLLESENIVVVDGFHLGFVVVVELGGFDYLVGYFFF